MSLDGWTAESAKSAAGPLELSDGRVALPKIAAGSALSVELIGRAHTDPIEEIGARLHVRSGGDAVLTEDRALSVEVEPLSIDLGGCGCQSASGAFYAVLPLFGLLLRRRRSRG